MKIFCIEGFKIEFEKLLGKKSYKTIEKYILEYFFDKDIEEICSGTRLNNSSASRRLCGGAPRQPL